MIRWLPSRRGSLIVLVLAGALLAVVTGTWWANQNARRSVADQEERRNILPSGQIVSQRADTQTPCEVTFAAIGDYGLAGSGEAAVARLVSLWQPDLIITLGDNNYPDGEASTIDENIGQYFHEYIYPYQGTYGQGATINRFFPALGNHDWNTTDAQPYKDYFTLPGNERYYDFTWGPVHFFVLDSDEAEPDGISASSAQARWLQEKMFSSNLPWQIVYLHHPPYSSARHGSDPELQWSYKQWGADLILAGHDHVYERLMVDDLTYIVNGLGGKSIYNFERPLPQSRTRFNDEYGAMRVTARPTMLELSFITVDGEVVDHTTIEQPSVQFDCAGAS